MNAKKSALTDFIEIYSGNIPEVTDEFVNWSINEDSSAFSIEDFPPFVLAYYIGQYCESHSKLEYQLLARHFYEEGMELLVDEVIKRALFEGEGWCSSKSGFEVLVRKHSELIMMIIKNRKLTDKTTLLNVGINGSYHYTIVGNAVKISTNISIAVVIPNFPHNSFLRQDEPFCLYELDMKNSKFKEIGPSNINYRKYIDLIECVNGKPVLQLIPEYTKKLILSFKRELEKMEKTKPESIIEEIHKLDEKEAPSSVGNYVVLNAPLL